MKKFICMLIFFSLTCPSFSSLSYATSCEVGDTAQGRWQIVGNRGFGECIIPGPADPESSFLVPGGDGTFRIEGGYKLTAVLTSKGFFWTPPECKSACIKGFTDWACDYYKNFGNTGIYGGNGQLCTHANEDGSNMNYICYEEKLTLYEWVCTTCSTQYNQKQQECGENRILNWSNETCTGECDLCTEQFNETADRCGGATNIIYWDQVKCEGACKENNLDSYSCPTK